MIRLTGLMVCLLAWVVAPFVIVYKLHENTVRQDEEQHWQEYALQHHCKKIDRYDAVVYHCDNHEEVIR